MVQREAWAAIRTPCEHVFVRAPTSTEKGSIAEAALSLAAVKEGVVVLRPIVEGRRYDLVFDIGLRLYRVQCKWGRVHGDRIVVQTSTCRFTPAKGYVRSTYTPDEVDLIAIYCGELDRSYLVRVAEVAGLSQLHLRLAPAKNNQRVGVRMAEQYGFSGAVAQLEERRHGMAEARGSSPLSSTHTDAA